MNLGRQQIEAQLLGAANIRRRSPVEQERKNYFLSLMLYKRLCDQYPKVHAASSNHVGPLA